MELPDALAAEGIVCAVGAGGKKTAMAALADACDRATVTATVRIPKAFADNVARIAVTDDPASVVRDNDEWPLEVVPGAADDSRHGGYENATVAALRDVAPGPVLVKADGARMRRFKAPGDREPQLPKNTDTVLAIASVHAVGEPLDEGMVHRPERVSNLTGRPEGETVTTGDVATVLGHERGGMKDVPAGATTVAVVNMVDDDALEATAREVAAETLARSERVDRVALTKLDEARVVDVID
ncbi:selenium cofactor biosynthesis protein YqeC [Halosegnis marinus]|uniref:Selenium cofactor biosynthesis protein YqeC n=1 Tax=Halosegnis marinus TaxID=3034023 RepID=A0ABD5ZSR6_9EURY|nr:selenium cofactor biosynthesis protein YqeC [Halosegnis sp. DT85]